MPGIRDSIPARDSRDISIPCLLKRGIEIRDGSDVNGIQSLETGTISCFYPICWPRFLEAAKNRMATFYAKDRRLEAPAEYRVARLNAA